MNGWEYTCRVAADGTSERLESAPEFPPKERNACVAPAADGDGSSPTLLNALPDGSGAVLLVFMGNDFPAIDDIEAKMAGFDTWGILTAERPFIEMSGPRAIPTFEFNTPGWESTAELLGTVAHDGGGQWGGAASGALINSGWPFFYRTLAVRTPPAVSESLAEIAVP